MAYSRVPAGRNARSQIASLFIEQTPEATDLDRADVDPLAVAGAGDRGGLWLGTTCCPCRDQRSRPGEFDYQ
jgi:hypothetical protein